jgi:hypothetical protein
MSDFQVVVIIVIWIISLLVIYMLFLICLDPLLNKRAKGSYQEHTNEEVCHIFFTELWNRLQFIVLSEMEIWTTLLESLPKRSAVSVV